MRIYVLTQEDAFYIPRMLDYLLEARADVFAVGIVPGELQAEHAPRYLRMLGPRDFALQVLHVAWYRCLDTLGRIVPLRGSYSVRGAARRHRVPVERIPRVNDSDFVERLRSRGVELIVSIACPQILRRPLLNAPARGCINIHGALLPRYQGLFPSFWVLAKGELETGVTVHYVNERIDQGDILVQQAVPIRDDDTMHRLVLRSKVDVGKKLLVDAVEQIERGVAHGLPMDLSKSSYFSYPDAAAVREFRSRGRRFI